MGIKDNIEKELRNVETLTNKEKVKIKVNFQSSKNKLKNRETLIFA